MLDYFQSCFIIFPVGFRLVVSVLESFRSVLETCYDRVRILPVCFRLVMSVLNPSGLFWTCVRARILPVCFRLVVSVLEIPVCFRLVMSVLESFQSVLDCVRSSGLFSTCFVRVRTCGLF